MGESPEVTDTSPIGSPMKPIIENFRNAACIGNVYRCANTDGLGGELLKGQTIEGNDKFLMDQMGLILDLRSPSERMEDQAQKWMKQYPNLRVIETDQNYQATSDRCVVRIDVLSPSRFMTYIEQEWLSASEKAQATWFKIVDGQKLHELRIEKLNERGLAGLNEAILETGKEDIRRALETITKHLEINPEHPVAIHCVQGKDRTGMLVMLLQSLLGFSDEIIISDYYRSNEMLSSARRGKVQDGSAAAEGRIRQKGKLDRKFFSGTNKAAMITTLEFLRSKYGSISPGYLDSIGFDESWRRRLRIFLTSEIPKPVSKL